MVNSFDELMSSNRSASLDNLAKKLKDVDSSQGKGDDRFWKPTTDKAGNGSAIIRFLPETQGETDTLIKMIVHQFEGPTGQTYKENSLLTLDKADPVDDLNKRLWKEANDGNDDSKAQAKLQKKQTSYVSNIYVVRDPAKPENEGRVFLYRYGKKIFDKINRKANPAIEGIPRVNVFDLVEGADFHLIVYRTAGEQSWPNYDQSEFGPVRALFVDSTGQPDRNKLKEVWAKQYKLTDLLAADKFKSYDDLKRRLNEVLGQPDDSLPPFTMQQAPPSGKVADMKPVSRQADLLVEDDDDDPALAQFEAMARNA